MPRISSLSPRILCALLFGLALALRLAGLTWGLPTAERWYSLHPDERQIAIAVAGLDFFGGDFNPDFYNYPSLAIYLAYFMHGIGALFGVFGATQTPFGLLSDLVMSGRLVTAFLGAATAPLVFLVAREVVIAHSGHQNRVAALAGILMALSPGHLQHSHFATVDVPATFFITLCLWLSVRTMNNAARQRTRLLILAALAAGLAAATKYNAGLVALAPIVAAWLPSQAMPGESTTEKPHSFGKHLALIFAAAFGGFIVGCPGSALYFRDFWGDGKYNGFAYELFVHPRQGSGEIFENTGNGWLYHLTFNLPFAVSVPVLLAALLGAALIVRRPGRVSLHAPLLAFAFVYFLSLGFSQVRFMRYVLPLAPVLCVFAVHAVYYTLPKRELFGKVATIALLFVSFVGATDVLAPFLQPDARDRAAQKIKAEIAAKSTTEKPVVIGLVDNPWFWTPPLVPQDAPPGTPPPLLQQLLTSNPAYELSVIGFDMDKFDHIRLEYLVISEFEWRDKERLNNAGYAQLRKQLDSGYTPETVAPNKAPSAFPGRAFVPHDFLYSHPEVRIYRRR